MIVYVSENVMEEFPFVLVCLTHEVFHVITDRHREKRAKCFMVHMIQHMEHFLFQDVKFSQDGKELEKEEAAREKLMNYWFEVNYLWEELLENSNNKLFYGELIKVRIVDVMNTQLTKILNDLKNRIKDEVMNKEAYDDYNTFREKHKRMIEIIENIERNIIKILYDKKVERVAEALLFIYRETYADIACVLTLELTADQYRNAFIKSIQFKYDDKTYCDYNKGLRELLVAKVVKEFLPQNKQSSWKDYFDDMDKCVKSTESNINQTNTWAQTEGNGKGKGSLVIEDNSFIISSTDQTVDLFDDYLSYCAESFSRQLNKIDNIKEFREKMEHVLREKHQDILLEILSGGEMK